MESNGTFNMHISVPTNSDQAISTGAEIGLKIFDLSQTLSLELFDRGTPPDLIDNCMLHAHIVALGFMVTKMSISMNGETIPPDINKFASKSSSFQKQIVDAVHKMLMIHVKNGVFVKVDKTGDES